MAGYNTGLTGLQMVTREEYDGMEKTDGTLYVVKETGGFSLFLGDLALIASGGNGVTGIGSPLLYLCGADGHAGTITETEKA